MRVFGFAIAAGFIVIVAGSGEFAGVASTPTPPNGCFVAEEPVSEGPAAPTGLDATVVIPAGLGQADLTWLDESDDETCFVVERRLGNGPFEVIGYTEANAAQFRDAGPYQGGDQVFHRVYSATAVARSDYSNESSVEFPFVEPTPTPRAFQRGDVNCDGDMDPLDALAVLRHDAGLDPNLSSGCPGIGTEVPLYFARGDVNCDESIDPRDTLTLLREDAGMDLNLPLGCPSLTWEDEVPW